MVAERSKSRSCLHKSHLYLIILCVIALLSFVMGHAIEVRTWRGLQAKVSRLHPGQDMQQTIRVMGKPSRTNNRRGTNKVFFYYNSFRFSYLNFARDFLGNSHRHSEAYIEFDKKKLVLAEARPNYKIPFNSKDWRKSTAVRRHCMVYDLIEKYGNKNLKKKEILALLGKPDVYPPGKPEAQVLSENYFQYDLDMEWSFISIDTDILVVTFDKNGRVKRMYIEHT